MKACCRMIVGAIGLWAAFAQVRPTVDDLLKDLADDRLAAGAAGSLVEFGSDPRVIPALRAKFLNSVNKETKQSVALSMERLKVDDPSYFHYLASFAQQAVDDDAPYLSPVISARAGPGMQDAAMEKWASAHGTTVDEERKRQGLLYPTDLMLLSVAEDQRAAPIFRKGLHSANPLLAGTSAIGLGMLRNEQDIEPIIDAAGKNGVATNASVGKGLAFFRLPHQRALILKRVQGTPLEFDYRAAVSRYERRLAKENSTPKAPR